MAVVAVVAASPLLNGRGWPLHLIWPRWRLAEVSLKLVVSKAVNIGVFVAAHPHVIAPWSGLGNRLRGV